MLERAAATLEPCTLRHSIPASVRTRRRLHTGFWQHGAAALDLSPLWISTTQESHDADDPMPPANAPDRLNASTFLLDFLYPRGTMAFLRRLSPSIPDRQASSSHTHVQPRSRRFTSTTHEAFLSASEAKAPTEPTIGDQPQPCRGDQDALQQSGTPSSPSSRPALMQSLMARSDTEYFGPIWEHWCQLEPQQQNELRPQVITYLHKSTGLENSKRVVDLFSQLGIDSWDRDTVAAAVAAELRLGNVAAALDIYHTGLHWRRLVGGLVHLVTHALQTSSWDMVCRVWDAYGKLRAVETVEFGNLNDVAEAIPDLGTQVLQFQEYLVAREREGQSIQTDAKPEKENDAAKDSATAARTLDLSETGPTGISRLLKGLAKCALHQPCQPHEALPLLKILRKADFYYMYISRALEARRTTHVPDIYRVYRTLPRFRPNWKMLHGMFELYYPHDVVGLEQIYEDYHRAFGSLDQWGFRKYLKFYASRGDVRSVRRLWTTYVKKFKHKAVIQDPETWNHVLNAYKNRGIVEDTQRAFDDMATSDKVTPDVVSWNILLSAYVKTERYDDAIAVFEDLCQAVDPDSVSFGTMMAMSGALGDLDYTLTLYERAQSLRVQAHASVFYGLVNAYCQNDKIEEAQNVCINASTREIGGNQVDLWNCLLKYQGHRRDLRGIYQILDLMKEHDVEWNPTTYDLLMRSLVLSKEAHHAYRLLRTAVEDKTFPVRERHFAMVMSSALRSRDMALVRSVVGLMSRTGYSMSMKTSIAAVDAELRRRFKPWEEGSGEMDGDQAREFGRTLVEYYERMLQAGERDALFDPERKVTMRSDMGDVEHLASHATTVQEAMEVLIQFRDFVSLEELLQLFSRAVTGQALQRETLPLPMLESMMLADFLDGQYDKVKEAWGYAWDSALRLGRPAAYQKNKDKKTKEQSILPRYQYALSGAVNSMQRTLRAEGDHKGLVGLVEQVTRAGFKLHSGHWNNICRSLAEMGQWVTACAVCEDVLMPNWQGWAARRVLARHARNAMPLERRRMGNAPRFLRPNAETLVMLADHYLVLKKQGPWSNEARRTLDEFYAKCPKLVDAFRTRLELTARGVRKPEIKDAW
ncbi:hypothetical protein ACRALDRAFT_2108189 [Sodiomyces alcalophilus JCM 7366]|uniref:uncharacterized protein n=1 Tax=Sodiomyces alcalophilus JCM 7366 TaxID=591952 RepID=UPI0039B3B4DD